LQLHGRETPERVAAVRARFNVPVMKAVGVSSRADLAKIPAYAAVADRLLFDAKPPPDAALPGGNGRAFDWTLLRGLDLAIPHMLSGGLDAGNVKEAIRVTRAPGVDVSSGVESAPGVKDAEKIAAFVAHARKAYEKFQELT
jgi:phosphoribosylanthranilate isomerase